MLSQEQLTAALKAFGEAVPAGTKLHSLKVTPSVGYADTEAKPVFVFVLVDSDKDVQRLSQVIDRGIKSFETEPGLTTSLLRDKPQTPATAEKPEQPQSLPDPSWVKMDPSWVADFIRDGSKFDADKIEQMLQFAIDAAKNCHAVTVTLDAKAVEALSQYRRALSAFQAVGHGTDEGADRYLDTERAAEELGRQVAALAPATDSL